MLNADARFIRCFAEVDGFEGRGKFTDDRHDPGGATQDGITLAALSEYLGRQATVAELRAMTPEVKQAVYRKLYWAAVQGDNLPAGVDLICFDSAVNCGPGHAARWLQDALDVADDGDIGPATLRALADCADDKALIQRIADQRTAYYRGLHGFADFGHGWLSRLNVCLVKAKFWVDS